MAGDEDGTEQGRYDVLKAEMRDLLEEHWADMRNLTAGQVSDPTDAQIVREIARPGSGHGRRFIEMAREFLDFPEPPVDASDKATLIHESVDGFSKGLDGNDPTSWLRRVAAQVAALRVLNLQIVDGILNELDVWHPADPLPVNDLYELYRRADKAAYGWHGVQDQAGRDRELAFRAALADVYEKWQWGPRRPQALPGQIGGLSAPPQEYEHEGLRVALGQIRAEMV